VLSSNEREKWGGSKSEIKLQVHVISSYTLPKWQVLAQIFFVAHATLH
jgi:hypothetical protein